MSTYRTDLFVLVMKREGFTNETLARTAGVAPKTVSAIRNGSRHVEIATLEKVLAPLKFPLYALFIGAHSTAQSLTKELAAIQQPRTATSAPSGR